MQVTVNYRDMMKSITERRRVGEEGEGWHGRLRTAGKAQKTKG